MKKLIFIIFSLISLNAFAVEKSTTFTNEIFKKAQTEGKIVVINSWNETCYTCKKQIKILDQAEKTFKNVLFLSYLFYNLQHLQELRVVFWLDLG